MTTKPLIQSTLDHLGDANLTNASKVLGILTEELESAKEPLTKELQRFTTLNNQETAFFDAARQHKMATSPSHNTPSPASPTHTGKAHCGRI